MSCQKSLRLKNIEFKLADAEALDFPENSFDRILCSSALIWMADIPAALQLWRRLLKPGGILGFHAFAQTSFIAGIASQKAAEKQGISLTLNQPTGTREKCYNLLAVAGFEDIKIAIDRSESHYIPLEKAKSMWIGCDFPAPGQFPHPLAQLSPTQLARVQADFFAELEALNTDRGIWNDITIFYTFGSRSC
ncbi:MAG: methyltransferase domain-containing protein [Geitlerinemataceae cyanobacterium]